MPYLGSANIISAFLRRFLLSRKKKSNTQNSRPYRSDTSSIHPLIVPISFCNKIDRRPTDTETNSPSFSGEELRTFPGDCKLDTSTGVFDSKITGSSPNVSLSFTTKHNVAPLSLSISVGGINVSYIAEKLIYH